MGIPFFLLYPEQAVGEHKLQRAKCWPFAISQGFSALSLTAFTTPLKISSCLGAE